MAGFMPKEYIFECIVVLRMAPPFEQAAHGVASVSFLCRMSSPRPRVIEAGVDTAVGTSGVAINIKAEAGATVIAKVNEGESRAHVPGNRIEAKGAKGVAKAPAGPKTGGRREANGSERVRSLARFPPPASSTGKRFYSFSERHKCGPMVVCGSELALHKLGGSWLGLGTAPAGFPNLEDAIAHCLESWEFKPSSVEVLWK